MQIIFSEQFKKQLDKIKDKSMKERIIKQIEDLKINSEKGKPLKYELKECRSVRIASFRLIYFMEQEAINIVCIDERKKVYKNLTKYLNYNIFYI